MLGLVGCFVGACSSQVVEDPANSAGSAGTGGIEQHPAGAGQGGEGLSAAIEAGAAGAFGAADAGASGESFAGAGGGDPGGGSAGEFAQPTSIWSCENPAGEVGDSNAGNAGASGAGAVEQIGPPMSVPPGGEATLAQLVGLWTHASAALGDYWGLSDDFQFNADGTGSQGSGYWSDSPNSGSTTYAGTIELANHVITIDSTAGTQDTTTGNSTTVISNEHEKLPHQIIHYGYSYDSLTDTLYVNTATCTAPLPFKRD